MLKKVTDSTYLFTANDISTLEGIAQQCPLTGGRIVYNARALVNGYYQTIIEYTNACHQNASIAHKVENLNAVINKNNITLYPNPTTGNITVEYKIVHNAILEITDISGKLVGTYNLPFDSYKMQITDDKLENGMYLYRIVSDNSILKTGKIAILK